MTLFNFKRIQGGLRIKVGLLWMPQAVLSASLKIAFVELAKAGPETHRRKKSLIAVLYHPSPNWNLHEIFSLPKITNPKRISPSSQEPPSYEPPHEDLQN